MPDVATNDDDADYGDEVTRSDLIKRMKHVSTTLDNFWRRWKMEYLLVLRESHRQSPQNKGTWHRIKA